MNLTNLCTVCIPTRERIGTLLKAIQSVADTSSHQAKVLCRVDDDDLATQEALIRNQVPFITGDRGRGYRDCGKFYSEMAQAATTDWLFFSDDDSTLEGGGWMEQLELLPLSGVIAQPERYTLGGVQYGRDSCDVCAPIIPRKCVPTHFPNGIADCPDYDITHTLLNAGWQKVLLNGLTWNHARQRMT